MSYPKVRISDISYPSINVFPAVTDEEIKSMSVGQLKKLLESKGVPCKDCVQREDFVEIALGLKDHSDVETAENSKTLAIENI